MELSYTVDDAADVLRCSPQHVRNLMAAGKLKYKNIAVGPKPKLRIPGKALQAFLDEAA